MIKPSNKENESIYLVPVTFRQVLTYISLDNQFK